MGKYQDSGCESLGSINKFVDAFAIPTRAENPKVVDAKLLQNIWRIDLETEKTYHQYNS